MTLPPKPPLSDQILAALGAATGCTVVYAGAAWLIVWLHGMRHTDPGSVPDLVYAVAALFWLKETPQAALAAWRNP